ncbi:MULTISPECIES: DNA glycosylase AlkZ-like family protein [Anaeromyxobacter]|uniref:DNA glycosylase AlkZ-like family protein n=1 Tax=Anaeromyxobacter TaxID=161492 RepID=UPI001F59CB03|nr:MULTISPECIES: crosslink repair DNA glycosylase YcaQ family protein [unclassified Anaeromyxobacter]
MPAPALRRARPRSKATALTPAEARAFLVGHHALAAPELPPGPAGVRALLARLRCIQLDPLDPLGTNADLVALARVDGIARGDVYRHLLPGHAFEHFAKERCLLPAASFSWYRAELAIEAPWWSHAERLRRLPAGVVQKVLDEVRERGPIAADDLADHGRVEPLDWSGWRGTPRAAKMALEVLQTRCEVVVSGRGPRGKLYDVPDRALPAAARTRVHPPGRPTEERVEAFRRWALLERVEAAGLLSRAGGATWSMLDPARRAGIHEALLAEGAVEEVQVVGSTRTYLAPRGFAGRRHPSPDGRLRLLGPLDPLIWDRALVRAAFGFDYSWEVYRPAHLRRFGWYVCPLLRGDALVGRLDGAVEKGALRIRAVWAEAGGDLDRPALLACLERHAAACGVERVLLPRRIRVNRP